MEYLGILAALTLATFLLQRIKKIQIYSNFGQLILANVVFLIVGVVWDSYAVWRGHWSFDKILGLKIGLLPIEELLFMLVIPYFVITVYKIITAKR